MNIMKRMEQDLWDPFDFVSDLKTEMEKALGRSVLKKNGWENNFRPDMDVVEKEDAFIIKADLPGMKKEDLDIKLDGRILTLKGEKKQEKEEKGKNYHRSERLYGAFTRVVELPADIRADQVKAAYQDGVLEVTLPKTENAKAKHIAVEVK